MDTTHIMQAQGWATSYQSSNPRRAASWVGVAAARRCDEELYKAKNYGAATSIGVDLTVNPEPLAEVNNEINRLYQLHHSFELRVPIRGHAADEILRNVQLRPVLPDGISCDTNAEPRLADELINLNAFGTGTFGRYIQNCVDVYAKCTAGCVMILPTVRVHFYRLYSEQFEDLDWRESETGVRHVGIQTNLRPLLYKGSSEDLLVPYHKLCH